MEYTAPVIGGKAFNCPHCSAFAKQDWTGISLGGLVLQKWMAARCQHCNHPSFWFHQVMMFPKGVIGPLPNPDLPDDIKADVAEARAIAATSPRGAGALLRLAIQKICVHLGQNGENLNADIGALVAKGLPVGVQKALDAVRVIGNDAVHPGQIDLRDNAEMVESLFRLVNFIAEKVISEPKAIDTIYGTLPQSKHAQIEQRDKGK
jgi:hypothetical protein